MGRENSPDDEFTGVRLLTGERHQGPKTLGMSPTRPQASLGHSLVLGARPLPGLGCRRLLEDVEKLEPS